MKTSIGDRMKRNYENRYRFKLTRRMPVIMRLDGKAFHTLTKGCRKPFDESFSNAMNRTASCLYRNIQGSKLAYVQSDEISILITDFDTLDTEAWFDYNVQKMASVAAGMASAYFTTHYLYDGHIAVFDCRVFNIPKEEVCNYFVWRQQDWIRNSLQMFARSFFSAKQLHKKKSPEIHEMLHVIGQNWAMLDQRWKNGYLLTKAEDAAPIFTKQRDVIERYY